MSLDTTMVREEKRVFNIGTKILKFQTVQ